MKRRILSIITALALCLSLCPTWALAVEGEPDTGLCDHHPEHTEDCGYTAPTKGHDCGHEHTAACYTLGVLPDADSGDPYQVGGDTENLLDCHHSHDSACGYVQANPGAPCGYVCRICPIEDLIAALPEQVTEDNADDVRAQLDEILALYRELDEGEQGQLDLSRCYELQEALDNANAPMMVVGEINIDSTRTNILTEEAGDCPGHTFTGTTASPATIYVESGVHNVTFSGLNITAAAEVGIAPHATMNLTITETNTIKAGTRAGIYVPKDATLVITDRSTGTLEVSSLSAAGIGGGAFDPSDPSGKTPGNPNCGTVEINGGTVAATGGSGCAGIGGGSDASYNPGNGGTVTISGGTVTAKGGSDDDYCGGAGIGGSVGTSASNPAGNGGTLTINGGHVTLTPGAYGTDWGAAYGFGQGSGSAPGGTCELTLADASYLDSGTTLDPNGKYTINGDPTADMIVVPELVYTGEVLDTSGIKIDDSKTGSAEHFGRTFAVKASADGWTYTIDPAEVKAAGDYTVTFSKEGHTSISKTFTVAQSGTQFVEDGEVKTYKDGAECSDFTASDTIKVVAMPTATGTAPQKAAARLRADPTAGQMAVYVGDMQVSEPVGAVDGSYTMTVPAADVLICGQEGENGKYTLIAKFVGNTNMADAEAQVEVAITPNLLTEDMVSLSAESGTYSGTEQKPTATVAGLTEGTDYDITYTGDFTNAGEHTLTVTGKGIYRGTVEKTYTIGKATPTIAWANNVVTLTYTGQPADIKPVITLVNGETFSGTITYHHTNTDSSESGESKAGLPTNAGIYVVGARIPEQDNYTAATTASLMLIINKADQTVPAAPTADEENIKDTSITLDTIENAEYKRDDGEWQDSPVFTDLSPNTPYTFYARLKEDANHNASPDSAAASITTKKTMLGNGYVTAYGMYTYTGAAIVPSADEVDVMVNGKKVDPNQYTISASNNINAGVAVATLTATATETGNYSGSVSSEFTINRAALTVKANDQSITYGESIATSTDKVTPDGLVGDDRLESVTLEASTSDVPGGTIKPSGAIIQNGSGEDVTRNYDITYQPGALTIDKANVSLTTTPAANTLTYTGEAQALVSGGTASIGEVVYSLTETDGYSTTIPTGTNAGSYEVWYKVEGNENYNGIAATKIDVTISRKPVTTPTIKVTPDSYEYTGQQIKPGEDANTTVTVKDGDIVISASEYTLSYGENTHVGPGTVKVTDSGSGNYQITETTQNFTITKKLQNKLSITGKPETTAYGDTFTLTTSGGSGEGAVTWSVTGPAIVSATGEVKITGVDSVTVTANKAGGDDYENAEAILTFEATKKAVTAVVTADNKTYDGNTSATVTASVNNSDLVTDDSITITGVSGTFDNANAGTGKTVTVDGTGASISGNNADKYQVTFPASTTADIEKAIASVKTAPTAKTLTYTGEAQALVNAGTASVGEVVYSLTEAGTYSTAIPTGTNAGSYTVWYKIADTDNYTGTTPVKVDVTISKINYTGTIAASTSGKFGREKTYDLSDLLPEGYKLGTPTKTDANSIFEGTPTVSGTVLTYKLADNAGVGKIGTITIPVTESTNYNPFDLTITVTVTDKIVPTLTITPISVPYTGSAVPAGAIQGTATADGKNIPGSWSFADGQALTNVADSGTKTVNFTPADEVKDDYAPATGTVRVTITKATPSLSLTPSPTALPNGGTVTLTLSGLPSGGSATVSCSNGSITVIKGSGDTWTADLPAGGASYTFTASYSGDGNHNGATANCTVSVEKITPTLSLTANPTSLHGGGTVTLTLSGLPAGGTATVTCSGGITVTAGAGNTWTATLPNNTATYTFTASYAGNASYNAASASCTVEAIEVTVLPNPPAAEDGKQYQVVMEDGISEVPAGLQSIETLNTPEKLETAMKTAITQANSGVPQDNTAVYDVELQISDNGGATWTKATAANFPANGLTVTLPYPAGTNSSYTFTVVHMFTTSDFNKTPGDTETPRVTNTASGLQFTVTGLSPISVGWVQPSTPTTPTGPTGGGGGGGGSSVSTYAVTVEKSEHGKVTSNRTNASSGSTVTLTVTPDSGYVLDTLAVTDSRGNEIKLSAQGGGKYTFTMPSRAVTVKATFAPLPEDTEKPCDGGADCPSHGFTDLGTVGTWYHEAVDYVLRNNLMGGYGNGLFGPNDTLTRAQFAQILYNKEGRPAVTGGGIFTDVAPGAWCAPAVTWAAERGIVGGYGNGMFGPNDNITREQLAVMLWRYAGSPAATDKELHFTDADKASGYALDALRWAVENSIINGKGGGILDPKGLATRAQVAQMLKNFLKDE